MSVQDIPHILSSQERLDRMRDNREEFGSNGHFSHSKQGPNGEHYQPLPLKVTSLTDQGEEADLSDELYERGLCGVGICHPSWSQRLANLNVFVIFYGIAGIWSITLGTLLGSQVTSIERHFGMSSSKTGLLMSSNEIGYLIIVILGSHLGKYSHIPRFLSASGIIYGLAAVAMSFGRLMEPSVWQVKNEYGQNTTLTDTADNFAKYLCTSDLSILPESTIGQINDSFTTLPPLPQDKNDALSALPWAFWLLVVCLIVTGAVKSYRIPLFTYYIESNIADKNRSGLLLGVAFTAMLFGPPVALFLGGYISSLPVDLKETSMSKHDQRWVGAWWLGFILIGLASIVCSLPIMFFPRYIRKKKVEDQKRPRDETSFRLMLLDLPKSLARIFRRPIYVLALVFACIEGLAFQGWFAFSQKYLETQFNKTAQEISTISGVICLFSFIIGTLTGGFFTSRLKLEIRGCALVALTIAGTTALMDCLLLVFGCSNSEVVGTYGHRTPLMDTCACKDDIFIVCGDDNINYLSPCLAGCLNSTGKIFSNCTSINNGQAKPGLCDLDCNFFIPYFVLYFCGSFLGTVSIVPGFMMIVRSVEHRDQSLANGTANFCQTLIGMLPSPILFGRIIDSTCSLWSPGGSCVLYDREKFRFYFNGVSIGLRFASLVIMAVILWLAHRQKSQNLPKDSNVQSDK